jgi:hypothetical protein
MRLARVFTRYHGPGLPCHVTNGVPLACLIRKHLEGTVRRHGGSVLGGYNKQFPPSFFIELNGNTSASSPTAQNVSIVFSLLLFWSWCVRHFHNLIGSNKVPRLRARDAGISLCLSSTLPRRVTHDLYHIIRSKTRLCYSYSPGSYIP